jgi:hypothetical protein
VSRFKARIMFFLGLERVTSFFKSIG